MSTSSSSSSSSSGNDTGRMLDRIRILVNDESSVRWSDSIILLWLNDAILEIRDRRPDIVIDASGNRRTYSRIKTVDDNIDIEEIWWEAIVNYVCWRLLTESAEDTISQKRAEKYLINFEENLKN